MLTSSVLCSACVYHRQGQAAFRQGCPGILQHRALRCNLRRKPHRLTPRVANPRHNEEKKSDPEGTGSGGADQTVPDADPGVDSGWAKAQSFAAILGTATLSAVLTIQLSGKADLPDLAYQKLQGALPQAPSDKEQFSFPQFDLGAAWQGSKVCRSVSCFAACKCCIVMQMLRCPAKQVPPVLPASAHWQMPYMLLLSFILCIGCQQDPTQCDLCMKEPSLSPVIVG